MLNLIKRDLKLYWRNMVFPFIIILLLICAIAILNKDATLPGEGVFAGAFISGAMLIPFIPITIQWREISQETLRDLIALPCSRKELVTLRYIEVLFFSVLTIFLAHIGAWATYSIATHSLAPFVVADKAWFAILGIVLLILFAYPMPFMFRWDGKGFAVAFATVIYGIGPLIAFVSEKFSFGNDKYAKAFTQFVKYLKDHPGQATFGFLALFLILLSISYMLSIKSLSGRDF